MKPRDYQDAAVDALFRYWATHFGNPVVALPTGTGKSLVIAEFCRRALQWYPGTRILVLTHVKELIEQNFEKLLELWPTAPAGIYSAGLKRKDIGKPVTFAGIGSIARVIEWFQPDVILIDEGHTVSPKETTLYRKVITSCLTRNPLCKIATTTATPWRLGQGRIVEPGGVFTDICFDMTGLEAFNWFLEQGYLKPLIPKRTETEYDISSVHIASTGDYNLKELQEAVDKDTKTREAVAEMVAKGSDRRKWLVFAAGINHAEHVSKVLLEFGIDNVCIHSKSPEEERDKAVAAFKRGEIRCLVNNGCFTTGFDVPDLDLIAVIRHTASPGLWVQILGRGTRPYWPDRNGGNWHLWPQGAVASGRYNIGTVEGRLLCIAEGPCPNCLVLDFAANTRRLGPINDPKIPNARKKQDKPGDVPAKSCPTCLTYCHASARICYICGTEFPIQSKIRGEAGTDELIAGKAENFNVDPVEEWFDVETVTYSKFKPWNRSQLPSLRATYSCKNEIRKFSEYVNLEHEGHARIAACKWWRESFAIEPGHEDVAIPESVDHALQQAAFLRQPARLRVWINRKNPQITHREFS